MDITAVCSSQRCVSSLSLQKGGEGVPSADAASSGTEKSLAKSEAQRAREGLPYSCGSGSGTGAVRALEFLSGRHETKAGYEAERGEMDLGLCTQRPDSSARTRSRSSECVQESAREVDALTAFIRHQLLD